MKYAFLIMTAFLTAACASGGANSAIHFSTPHITDQEFEDGLPAPGEEYSEMSYEAQLKMDGGVFIRGNAATDKK